jgi:pyruvate dehydrogenase E1 component alpha subunit
VVEAGVFFESANFAALKKLPVLFLCENNQYSVYSHLRVRQPEGRRIAGMVQGIGIPALQGDGNDAEAVYDMTAHALAEIRAGSGPRFLEFATYRWREHCGPLYDNDIGYRTEAEFLEWKAKEPIARYAAVLLGRKAITRAQIEAMDAEIAKEVRAAFDFADASPFPEPAEAFADLYAQAR